MVVLGWCKDNDEGDLNGKCEEDEMEMGRDGVERRYEEELGVEKKRKEIHWQHSLPGQLLQATATRAWAGTLQAGVKSHTSG